MPAKTPRNIPPAAGSAEDRYPNMDSGEPAPLRPSEIQMMTDDDLEYILDGDEMGAGGHRSGAGIAGKSEFPSSWDEGKVRQAIEAILWGPVEPNITLSKDGVVFRGLIDGVIVAIPVHDYGRYWEVATAYPLSGVGVVRNESAGRRVRLPLKPADLARTLGPWP